MNSSRLSFAAGARLLAPTAISRQRSTRNSLSSHSMCLILQPKQWIQLSLVVCAPGGNSMYTEYSIGHPPLRSATVCVTPFPPRTLLRLALPTPHVTSTKRLKPKAALRCQFATFNTTSLTDPANLWRWSAIRPRWPPSTPTPRRECLAGDEVASYDVAEASRQPLRLLRRDEHHGRRHRHWWRLLRHLTSAKRGALVILKTP